MPRPVAILFMYYPEEASVVGDMLLGYVDLEFFMVDLVAKALGDGDSNKAVTILYRLRGANDRLNIADAILRPFMDGIELHGPYGQWLGAMRKCRLIRNQYAHCGWSGRGGKLQFVNLEAEGLDYKPVDLVLLHDQQEYFGYAIDLTFYLMDETRFRLDRRRRHKTPLPKSRAAPSLHSPED